MKKRFFPTGGRVEWTVPKGVTTIKVRISGGAHGGTDIEPGEAGEYREETLMVTPGDIIELQVGRAGQAIGTGVPGDDGFAEIEWFADHA